MTTGEHHSGHAHEHSDLKVRYPAFIVVGLAVLTLAGLVVSWLVFEHYAARQRAAAKPASPLAATLPLEPPAPRLQVDPREDLEKLREEEEQVLNTYGWLDKNTGVVRIPVGRAIEVLSERGLPARLQPKTAQDANSQKSREE